MARVEETQKLAVVKIPFSELAACLGLPDSVAIEAVHSEQMEQSLLVRLAGDGLPDGCRTLPHYALRNIVAKYRNVRAFDGFKE